ncbi:apolipoprotein C-III-like [Heterodontus francisci]|uniref:apolipoprotein C-III-like n=1 Tax=Heterodontus francisci TaxID=7792 RepID=UPI00355B54B9
MRIQVIALAVVVAFSTMLAASDAAPLEETGLPVEPSQTAQSFPSELAEQGRALLEKIQASALVQKSKDALTTSLSSISMYWEKLQQQLSEAWHSTSEQ